MKKHSQQWAALLQWIGERQTRWITAYPPLCTSLTRKDKHSQLAIYLIFSMHIRLFRVFRYVSIRYSRLLANGIFSSSLYLFIAFCPSYLSHLFSSSLIRFFSLYLSLSFFISSLPVIPRSFVREIVRILGGACGMPVAAGAITYDVDCQNLGEAPNEEEYR